MRSASKSQLKLIPPPVTLIGFKGKYLLPQIFVHQGVFKIQYEMMGKTLFFLIIIVLSTQSTYKISEEFFSNSFSTYDFALWTLTSSTSPVMKFTTCATKRLFGGYNVFVGDAAVPTQISRLWLNLIPHYSVTISAKIYKIDSWPNSTLFVMADGATAALFTFDSSNPGSSDICGNPNPMPDSINTNFNDNIVSLNVTIPHSSPTLNVTFISNLMGAAGAWGIRELSITMAACDESCQSCTNGTACVTCNTANGLTLSGAFCLCPSALTKRQKIVPCLAAPCVTCAPLSCTSGYYPSSVTSYCEPCNLACSICSDPTNSLACSGCAAGFIGNPIGGTLCTSCFSGCASCTSTASSACLTCNYQYFHYSLNNSCMTNCPTGYYGVQRNATCYPCVSPCANCVDSGVIGYFCQSCIAGYYLWNFNCSNACPINTYAYLGTCYSVCPTTTFANTTTFICVSCGANCAECSVSTTCTKCVSNAYLLSGLCYLSCPTLYYGDSLTQLCLVCDTSCQTCNGPASNQCLSCSSPAVLLNSSCYSSCPSNTYSNLCLPCNSSCLTCGGPSSSNCLSCSSPSFYHLNFTSCISTCNKGEVSNNTDMSCYACQGGEVAYFQVCTPCHPTCKTCDGIGFLQCVSCDANSLVYRTTCLTTYNSRVIYSPDKVSSPMTSTLTALLISYIAISLFLQWIFQYKTSLLPMLQIFQILSYTYFLTLPLSENTQISALMLYLTNFSTLFTAFQTDASTSLPIKFGLVGKTGYYFADSLTANIIMMIVVVVHLAGKYFSKRWNVIKQFYKKINPYLVSYTFRLIFLDLCLDFMLYLYCFEVRSMVGALSLALLIIDLCLIVVSLLCWKCVTELDGQQTALLYNNEIGHSSNRNQSSYLQNEQSDVQSKIKKNKILPSALTLCSKLPIPITLLLFSGNQETQIICLTVYFALYLIMAAIIPYRRRIYRWMIILGGLSLLANSAVCIAVMRGGSSKLVEVVWLLLLMVSLFLTVMQGVVNYKYFCSFFGYVCHTLKRCMSEQSPQSKNEQSQSNMTVDLQQQVPHKAKALQKPKSSKTQEQSQNKQNSVGKIRSNHMTSYLHLTNHTYPSENDVKLDLNL